MKLPGPLGNNDRPTNQPTDDGQTGSWESFTPNNQPLVVINILQDLPIRSRCQHLAFSQHQFRHHR